MNDTTPEVRTSRAERISNERLREFRNYWVADGHPIVGQLLDEVERLYAAGDEQDALAARVAELETERDNDLCVMVAYLRPNGRGESAWTAILANHFGPRAQKLVEDSGRFAAAYSRVHQIPPITIEPGPECDHGPGWQCVDCVAEGEFKFQPLGETASDGAR